MNTITGTANNDTLTGTAAADEIYGGDGNDSITGGSGNDVIYGGKGTDTVSYSGAYGSFQLTALYEGKNSSFSGFTVANTSGTEGTDTISSDVEYLTFSSGSVVYKIDNGTVSLVDTASPTIAVTSSATSLSASQTATVTFTLSESSSNFAIGDITTTGGTLSNFSGSGTAYTALFTPTANSTANGVVRVASSVFSDAAGNLNADGSDSNNSLIFTRIATTTITNATHNLSVIVDQNILSTSPTLLKDLKEYITYTNGVITKHSVEYAGLSFDYNQIDSLITTVVRDGDFTAEFTQEINDYLKTELNITYSVAVEVVGAVNIDGVILMVAGSDGNYVG